MRVHNTLVKKLEKIMNREVIIDSANESSPDMINLYDGKQWYYAIELSRVSLKWASEHRIDPNIDTTGQMRFL